MILSLLLGAALSPARAADIAAIPKLDLPATLPATPSLPQTALPALAAFEPAPAIDVSGIRLPTAAELGNHLVEASAAGLTASIAGDSTPDASKTREYSGSLFDKSSSPDASPAPEVENAAQISREIEEPSQILERHGIHATVPVYGSARIPSPEEARASMKEVVERYGRRPKSAAGKKALKEARQDLANSHYYELARRFGELVARGGQGRIAVVTGGGPGIMEAANRGAFEAGGPSIGYNIKLPHEQKANPYLTPGLSIDFEFFSPRKMNLRHSAVAMAFFPGGFGTMDELFEVLTLMQTGKIPRVPIVLVGEKNYWDKVLDFDSFSRMGLISEKDLKLFRFAETAETAWKIVSGHAAKAK